MVALGRKNYLIPGSDGDSERAAFIYRLIGSVKSQHQERFGALNGPFGASRNDTGAGEPLKEMVVTWGLES